MENIKRVYVPESVEPWWVAPVCWFLDGITAALKANNDKHWRPTIYIGKSSEQIKREHEAVGEWQAVYMGDV